MPELPEVETIRRSLADVIVGKKVSDLEFFHPRVHRHTDPETLQQASIGNTIKSIDRRGKYLLLNFGDDVPPFAIHLRMSGQLLLSKEILESKHLRARFTLQGYGFLNFVDIRTFGSFFLIDGNESEGYKKLGIEPLSDDFTSELLGQLVEKSSTPIKQFLLMQDRIAGIGNIYASEICFDAKILPYRHSYSLSKIEIDDLHSSILKILNRAISEMGTTLSDFRRPDGQPGEFSNSLKIYGHKDLPCEVCGTTIKRMVQHGRSTFFCPQCQH